MNSGRLPSTRDLRAFEVTVRLGSIKAAAEQLCLSPSAVSRRIQSLEEELGRALFVRDVQGLTLTAAGKFYAAELQDVFQALELATEKVRTPAKQRLVVMAPSMVAQAIVLQMDSFNAALPEIELVVHFFPGKFGSDPGLPSADIAISWGDQEWEGWQSRLISPRGHLVPICRRELLKDGRPLSTEELPEQTWVVARHFERGWNLWYERLGLPMPTPRRLLEAPNGVMAVEAADRSNGLVMGYGFAGFPDFNILSGRFVPAHAFHALTAEWGFRLNIPRERKNPAIERFNNWFFDQVWCMAAARRLYASGRPKAA